MDIREERKEGFLILSLEGRLDAVQAVGALMRREAKREA